MPEEEKKDFDKIIPIDIVKEMKDSYLDYSMSVIVSRALPDVRDGLKPVHRRILYSMHELGLSSQAKFRKSALVVGDVLGKYHPHGDVACYDALARMAQDFSMRYPLALGQGNFGSVDGDPPAAMRYTEIKMAPLAAEVLRDMEKETVDFGPNYDSSREEPRLLPSVVPNLLLNGTMGIAVGMATKIPPHNLGEVMEALVTLIDEPESSGDDLAKIVKGPDFPTGGIVFNEADIRHASGTGRGGVLVRGQADVVDDDQIVITSLPYQVNKADLIVRIADLVREKKLEGIKDIRDESTTLADTRVVIELKNNAYPEKVLNSIYKNTELETVFHYNMLALVDGVPKLLSLKGILEEFLKHRREVITRRAKFDLKQAEAREHILLGLKKALDHIDEIIKLIRKSKDVNTAEANLIKEFKFSELQARAILEMRLQKLAGLERQKVEDELKEKQALIKYLKELLGSQAKITAVVREEFVEIKTKYSDDRRTRVIKTSPGEIKTEDLIPNTEAVLVVTQGGYVKRTDPSEYRAQRRGGVGVIDLNTKEEDFVNLFITASTHDDLLFFTDLGKVYQIKMYDVPEGKRATRGKSVMNFLPLAEGEKVTSVLPLKKDAKTAESIMLATSAGVAKKVSLESLKDVRRSGIIAITLEDGDQLLSAFLVGPGDEAIVATREGMAIRFKESDVRQMGRSAMGVRVIKLKKGDNVVGANGIGKEIKTTSNFLVVAGNGYGKKTALKEYKVQKRGGSGIKTAKLTTKTGKLISGRVVTLEDSEIITISKHGQVIRTGLDEIPALGRQTQGVRVMKLRDDDSLASLTCL